jgi:hypothetical protein
LKSKNNSFNKIFFKTFILAAIVFASVIFISCPQVEPITDTLLIEVEDEFEPVIIIESPLDDSYYYSIISITGSIKDSSLTATDEAGRLSYISYTVANDASRRGKIIIGDDRTYTKDDDFGSGDIVYDEETGDFSIDFSAIEVDGTSSILQQSVTITVTAVDKNNNSTTKSVRLLENDGPFINLIEPGTTIFYFKDGVPIVISGSIGNSFFDQDNADEIESLIWRVSNQSWSGTLDLTEGSADFDGTIYTAENTALQFSDPFTYNPTTREFATSFDLPFGEFSVIPVEVRAVDKNNHTSYALFDMYTNEAGPSMTFTLPATTTGIYNDGTDLYISSDIAILASMNMAWEVDSDGPLVELGYAIDQGSFNNALLLTTPAVILGTDGTAGDIIPGEFVLTIRAVNDEAKETRYYFIVKAEETPPGITINTYNAGTGDYYARPGDTVNITFSVVDDGPVDAVSGLPSLTPSVTVKGGAASLISGYTYSYLLPADGSVTAENLALSITGVEDNVGNVSTADQTDAPTPIIYYSGLPTLGAVTANSSSGTSWANIGKTITLNFSSLRDLASNPIVTIAGQPATETDLGGNAYSATYIMAGGESEVDIPYTIYFTDAAGNIGTQVTDVSGITFDETSPTVSIVNSDEIFNSLYMEGNTIPIKVTFSEIVTVTGTPALTLNSGGTASYVSGSGSTILTFNYVVGSGESADPLNYSLTSSLSGTIIDRAGNSANLTLATPGSSALFTKSLGIDGIKPTVSIVDSDEIFNSEYMAGNTIPIKVTFSEAVNVTGTPTLTLNSGGTASYVSGSGSTILTLNYTVGAGEDADPLDYSLTSSLSGVINDIAGNSATLTLATPGSSALYAKNLDVDGILPYVLDVSTSLPSGYYNDTDTISITVLFNETVNVAVAPTLTLNSGGSASYAGGTGTSTLTFTYNIGATDNASRLDYSNTSSLSGTINDLAGNTSLLTLPALTSTDLYSDNLIVDTAEPTVSTVSTALTGGYYNSLDSITITVGFSEAVNVTGTPTLALNSGGSASYTGGTGTSTLTFNYNIGATDNASRLDYNNTSSLSGTINDLADNTSLLTLPGVTSTDLYSDNLVVDTTAPTVSTVSTALSGGYYNSSDSITITVGFSEAVNVTGTPTLALNSGGSASYTGGTGTSTLTFNYNIGATDSSTRLDYINTSSLSGTINDLADNASPRTLPGVGSSDLYSDNLVVDTTAPTVSTVSTALTGGYYNSSDSITITVGFSEAVNVTGTPTLALNSGGSASYTGGTGTSTLTFNYNIGATENSARLDYSNTSSLSGTINDLADNASPRTLPGVGSSDLYSDNLVVDTTAPTVSSVSSDETSGSYYRQGGSIPIKITFSEDVIVNTTGGTPTLDLNSDSDAVATYLSVASSVLTFPYTVDSDDDTNKLPLDYDATDSLTLNSGTIKDAAGNDAVLTLATPGSSLLYGKGLVVDTTLPTITADATSPTGTIAGPTTVTLTFYFDEVMNSSVWPTITFSDVAGDYIITYVDSSRNWIESNQTLEIDYTIAQGDGDDGNKNMDVTLTDQQDFAGNPVTGGDTVSGMFRIDFP